MSRNTWLSQVFEKQFLGKMVKTHKSIVIFFKIVYLPMDFLIEIRDLPQIFAF